MTEATQPQQEAQQQEAQQQDINISLQELGGVVQLIDICSKRGAFEGGELAQVGHLRGKFVAFLEANAPKEDAEATEEPAE